MLQEPLLPEESQLQPECSCYLTQSQEASLAWNSPQGPQLQPWLLYSCQRALDLRKIHCQRALTGKDTQPLFKDPIQKGISLLCVRSSQNTHMSAWDGGGGSKRASPATLSHGSSMTSLMVLGSTGALPEQWSHL